MDTSARRRVRCLFIALAVVVCVGVLAGVVHASVVGDDYPTDWKSADKGTVTDTWGYPNRSSESFVAWRMKDISSSDFVVPNLGDAKDWITHADGHWKFDHTPKVGAVAYFYSPSHVAWVEAVTTSTVTIEEYDLDGEGAYTERTIASSEVSYFIHFDEFVWQLEPVPVRMRATAVAAASMDTTGYVQYAIVAGGRLWHTIRQEHGRWSGRGDLGKLLGVTNVVSVAAASDGLTDEAQFAAVSADGSLRHIVRNKYGWWSASGDMGRVLGLSRVVGVSATGDGKAGEAQFVVLTADGRAWHTIRYANGTWQKPRLGAPFGQYPVKSLSGTADGTEGEVQCIIASSHSPILHTIRHPNGGWDWARSLGPVLGNDVMLSVAAARDDVAGQAHFAAIGSTGRVWHSVRNDKGLWSPRGDITRPMGVRSARFVMLTGDRNEGEVQAVVITSDGRMWHAVKSAGKAWTSAGDMSAVLGLQ